MTGVLLSSVNEWRWNLFDKLSQKASHISGPLGILSEHLHFCPPCFLSAYLFHALSLSNPIFRLAYIITSTAILSIFSISEGYSKKNWVKKQIKEICFNSKLDKKVNKLVYIASSHSHSNDFFSGVFFDFRTKSDITNLARNFDVTFIEAKSEKQLQEKISNLNDLDAVIIQAHGCSTCIQFSKDYFAREHSLGIFETLAKKLKPNAKISLISCSTGQGDENIAKKISILCSNSTIFSPNADYFVSDSESFKIASDGSCSFKSENFVINLFKKREDITKIYKNGNPKN